MISANIIIISLNSNNLRKLVESQEKEEKEIMKMEQTSILGTLKSLRKSLEKR